MPLPLGLVIIGCGARGGAYGRLAARWPDRYRLAAVADPLPERMTALARDTGTADLRCFADAQACFAAGRLGEVAIIATQDHDHVAPAIRALELGYDVVLEKPIAGSSAEVESVRAAAERTGRRVLVCHVLRYAPAFALVKGLIGSGILGELVAIDHTESIDPWHMVQSFVRGPWSVTSRSNPLILAKSCHDLDLLSWWADRECQAVSSFGELAYFTAANAPVGAPARCTDGCPHAATCPFDVHRLLRDQHGWLSAIDGPLAQRNDPVEVIDYLRTSPYSRCAWRCDNDVVDRQVTSLRFARGLVATFTLTGFGHGRETVIRGTTGVLHAGSIIRKLTGHEVVIHRFDGTSSVHDAPGGEDGHGGGDEGMIAALADELAKADPRSMTTGIHASVASHQLAFAAERSRLAGGQPVGIDDAR